MGKTYVTAVAMMGAMVVSPQLALATDVVTPPAFIGAMINVSNLDKSVDYFTRLVGLKEAARVPLGPGAWEVILSPSGGDMDQSLGLVYQPGGPQTLTQGNGFNRLVFFTKTHDEVDERVRRITAEGYNVVIPPSTAAIPGGRIYRYSHVKGPDNYTVELTWFDPKVRAPASGK